MSVRYATRRATAIAALLLALSAAGGLSAPRSFVGIAEAAVVIQRTTIYVSALPKGCVKTTYSGGIVVWKCGSVYYQPYQGRYVRVYIK